MSRVYTDKRGTGAVQHTAHLRSLENYCEVCRLYLALVAILEDHLARTYVTRLKSSTAASKAVNCISRDLVRTAIARATEARTHRKRKIGRDGSWRETVSADKNGTRWNHVKTRALDKSCRYFETKYFLMEKSVREVWKVFFDSAEARCKSVDFPTGVLVCRNIFSRDQDFIARFIRGEFRQLSRISRIRRTSKE